MVATSTHFVLHRTVVFRREEGFQLTLGQQLPRFIARRRLPVRGDHARGDLLPGPEFVVFFGVAACVTVASFLLLRTKLFH